MKWFICQWVDGSIDTLTNLMFQGLSYPTHNSMNNLTIKTIRKYIRLTHAYLLAYDKGLDIVAADDWLKQRRSHRGYSSQMDAVLAKLYFPCGRVTATEEAEVDDVEEYGDVMEAMLLLGMHSEIVANEETVEASAKYIYGGEDDEEESDESDDDEIERNATL